jgi:hypothetical protein
VLTAGAGHGVLTLFLRQTQIVSAGRTFSVNVGFSVSVFALLQIGKLLYCVDNLVKLLVFLLPSVNIFREDTVYCKNKNNAFDR